MSSRAGEQQADAAANGVAPVAVLGGGIAGAAACLHLAALGVTPLWLAPMLPATDKPGEHLSPAARPLLARLGAADLLAQPAHRAANTTISAWGSERLAERDAILHLEGPAAVLDRATFERDLAERALAKGARRIAATVAQAERTDGLWHLLADSRRFEARFVIDATGRTAVVGGTQARRFRADKLAALCCFLEQHPASEVQATKATLIEAGADGWWYAALLADGRLALSYFSDPDLIPRGLTRDVAAFRRLVDESRFVGRWVGEADFRFSAPPQLASAGTTWIAPAAGERWAAVGDAAAAFDPLSSHGMTTALWTAIAAADAAFQALKGDVAPLARYAAQVAGGVQDFLRARAVVYGQEARFAGRRFWQRRLASPQINEAG